MFQMNNFPSGGIEKVKIDGKRVRNKIELYTYSDSTTDSYVLAYGKRSSYPVLYTTLFSKHIFTQNYICFTSKLYSLYDAETQVYSFYTDDLYTPKFKIPSPQPEDEEKQIAFWYTSNNNNIYFCFISKTKKLYLYYLDINLQKIQPYFNLTLEKQDYFSFALIKDNYNIAIDDTDFNNPIIYFPIATDTNQIEIWYNIPNTNNELVSLGKTDNSGISTSIGACPQIIKSAQSNLLYVITFSTKNTSDYTYNLLELHTFNITNKELVNTHSIHSRGTNSAGVDVKPGNFYYDQEKEQIFNIYSLITSKTIDQYLIKVELKVPKTTKSNIYTYTADDYKPLSSHFYRSLNNYPLTCILIMGDYRSSNVTNPNIIQYQSIIYDNENENFKIENTISFSLLQYLQSKNTDCTIIKQRYINNKIYLLIRSRETLIQALNLIWLNPNENNNIYMPMNMLNK